MAAHVAPVLEQGLGKRYMQMPDFGRILSENPKFLGKKTGAGFFLYEGNKVKGINKPIHAQLQQLQRKDLPALSQKTIMDRCILIALQEAVRYVMRCFLSPIPTPFPNSTPDATPPPSPPLSRPRLHPRLLAAAFSRKVWLRRQKNSIWRWYLELVLLLSVAVSSTMLTSAVSPIS